MNLIHVYDADAAEREAEEGRCHYCGEYGQHPGRCRNCGYQEPTHYVVTRFHRPGTQIILEHYQELIGWLEEHGYDRWYYDDLFTARSSSHIFRADIRAVFA